jgi:hypothetical protein
LQLGYNVALAGSKIASMIPNPYLASAALAESLALGAQFATVGMIAGEGMVGAAEDKYNEWNAQNNAIPGLSGGMTYKQYLEKKNTPNPFSWDDMSAKPLSMDAFNIVNTFMSGFDSTFTPLADDIAGINSNTGNMAQSMNNAIFAVFGNTGDRMNSLAARARFGNLNSRGGGMSVNITVASQRDADDLRYALQLAAAR